MTVKVDLRLALAVLVILTASLLGCQLEGDKESETLPTEGYDTFKMVTDPVGTAWEVNLNGGSQPGDVGYTGRIGFYWDRDLDGKGDQFYQINRPAAGIVGLSFGADGFADGGQPFALAKLVPWQAEYEVPVDVLTHWIQGNAAIGYRKAEYKDGMDTIVYTDRVNDTEAEAPMTGYREVKDFRFYNLGLVSAGAASQSSLDDGDSGEITPSRPGDLDAHCNDYRSICQSFEGLFVNGWTVSDCVQNMYNRNDGNAGTRYNSCVMNNCGGNNASEACLDSCVNQHLEDIFGCGGEYGPELADVFYLVHEEQGAPSLAEKGVTISGNQDISVYFEYKDAECNVAGGQAVISINGHETRFDLPTGLGCDSVSDQAILGVTFTGLAPGDYDFTITLQDGPLQQAGDRRGVLHCDKAGTAYEGAFSVEGGSAGQAANPFRNFSLGMELFEVYDTAINKYNIGKGFVDARVVNPKFLFNFDTFDIAFIQGYIWSIANIDTYDEWNFTVLNNAIFTTTQNDRNTKFDESDDVQSFAFYIDQPLASGLFTFYGDTGWNLYPKGPGNANDDQVFVRGNFADTKIHIPFEIYNPVSDQDTQYVGCYIDVADTWAEKMFGAYPDGLGLSSFAGMNRDEFVQNLTAEPLNDYWRCAIPCMKRTMEEFNGCESLDTCLDSCGGDPAANGPNSCSVFDQLYVDVEVTVPPEFLASETYAEKFTPNSNGELPLNVGLFAATTAGVYKGVPGGFVPLKMDASGAVKAKYRIPLPYFPYLPLEFLPINSATSAGQAQIYVAIFDENNTPYGAPWLAPGGSHTADWTYLALFSYNWLSPTQRGWALSELEGNSITDFVNPYTTIIPVTFGKMGVFDADDLTP